MRNTTLFIIAALLLQALPGEVVAQAPAIRDFGDMADSIRVQTSLLTRLVAAVAFVFGVVITMTGLLKMRQNAENPNDPSARPGVAFIFVFAGAAMVALPALIMTGVITFFGPEAQVTDGFGQGNVIPFR